MASTADGWVTDAWGGPTRAQTVGVIRHHISSIPMLPAALHRLGVIDAVNNDEWRRWAVVAPGLPIDALREQLGPHTLWGSALAGFACGALTHRTPPALEEPDTTVFWRHAIAVAAVADLLNDATRMRADRRMLFASAMLHDVGKLVLGDCFPKAYARVCEDSDRRRQVVQRVEGAELGIDHALVGKLLAARWRLPAPLREGIGAHHDPLEVIEGVARFPRLVATIQLADALAHGERYGHPSRSCQHVLCDRMGLSASTVDSVVERSGGLARRITTILGPVLQSGGAAGAAQSGHFGTDHELDGRDDAFGSVPELSRWARGIMDFTSAVSADDGVSELCCHIVRCAASVLRLDAAVAFAAVTGREVVHCAAFEAGRVTPATVFITPEDGLEDDGLEAMLGALHAGPVMLPPPIATPVRERFRHIFAGRVQAMLPLSRSGGLVGGVLFDADRRRLEELKGNTDLLEALRAIFGCVMDMIVRAADAERTGLVLADANRAIRDAQEQFMRSRSLSTVTEMAAGAAHELNTPLAVISGRAQLLARQTKSPAALRALDAIREQSRTISEIVSQLVAFAKPAPPSPELIVLATWLSQIKEAWATQLGEMRGILDVVVVDDAVRVRADRDQLAVVFDALIRNAIDAMPQENARLVINSPSRATDDTVVVTVEDNGHGMAAGVVERAFDPFFSHRPAGRGRGLGLSVARRLVEVNGGRLWLESAPDRGTTVHVELPGMDRPVGESEATSQGPADSSAPAG